MIFLLIILLIVCFTLLFCFYDLTYGIVVYLITTIYGICIVRFDGKYFLKIHAFCEYFCLFILNSIYFTARNLSYPDNIAEIDLIFHDYIFRSIRNN